MCVTMTMVDSVMSKMGITLTTKWARILIILVITLVFLGLTVMDKYADTFEQRKVMYPSTKNSSYSLQAQEQFLPALDYMAKPHREAAFTSEPWVSRLGALQRGCASGLQGYQLTTKQVTQRYYSSSRAGFSVCKVPKAGSSFWTIVFLILQQQRPAEEVFLFPRYKLHNIGNSCGSRRPPKDSSLNIIVSRDPYARLFSGFIDKVFLAGWKVSKKWKQDPTLKYVVNDYVCGYNTSFADFLDIITIQALNGGGINRHWAPVHLLCNACDIRYQAVSHTETLTADTEYIVDKLQVTDSEKMSLQQMFQREEMNQTLRGLLTCVLRPLRSPKETCPDQLAYLYKLWQSLQIQGYLHVQSTFPWDFFENKNNPEEHSIVNLILDTITRRPLSNKDRKLQRRDALVSAYKNVGKQTIKRIQKMFMMDFRLFGYDINPPS